MQQTNKRGTDILQLSKTKKTTGSVDARGCHREEQRLNDLQALYGLERERRRLAGSRFESYSG